MIYLSFFLLFYRYVPNGLNWAWEQVYSSKLIWLGQVKATREHNSGIKIAIVPG